MEHKALIPILEDVIYSMKTEEIKHIAEPLIEAENLFLVDLSVSKDNVIEVFIDAQTGVDVKTCIKISKEIEEHLDREKEDFELTVSSAGIGCPFKVDGQYRKNIGNTVEIKFKDNNKQQGILKNFDQQSVFLECEEKQVVEGKKKKELVKVEKTFPRTEIKEIKDIVFF